MRISQLPGLSQQNGKHSWLTPLPFKVSLKDTSFHISINVLRLSVSLSRMLNEFLQKTFIFHYLGGIFKFVEFTFIENALIRDIFAHAPHHSNFAAKFLSSLPRQKETTHSPKKHSFENLSLPNSKMGWRKLETWVDDLLYHNSVRKLKTWSIRFFLFCMVCKFFK